jgi:hypothetical protein
VDEGAKQGIIITSEIMRFVKMPTIFKKTNIVVIERAVGYYMP